MARKHASWLLAAALVPLGPGVAAQQACNEMQENAAARFVATANATATLSGLEPPIEFRGLWDIAVNREFWEALTFEEKRSVAHNLGVWLNCVKRPMERDSQGKRLDKKDSFTVNILDMGTGRLVASLSHYGRFRIEGDGGSGRIPRASVEAAAKTAPGSVRALSTGIGPLDDEEGGRRPILTPV